MSDHFRTFTKPPGICNPKELAEKIKANRGWAATPIVEFAESGTTLRVVHRRINASDDGAVQAVVDAYVFDPTWLPSAEDTAAAQFHEHEELISASDADLRYAGIGLSGADDLLPLIRYLDRRVRILEEALRLRYAPGDLEVPDEASLLED